MDIDGIFLKIGAKFDDVFAAFQTMETQLTGQMAALGSRMQEMGKGMTVALTAPLVALGGVGLQTFGDFEAVMNRVGALTDATGQQMQQLTEVALDLGAKTQFSAKQAADGMAEFAAAGFDVNQTVAAMPGVLALAAAGQIQLGRSAEIAGSVMNGFNLQAEDLGRVANVLAQAANKSAANVSDLGSSFKYIGPIAAAVGVSFEETAAALSILANAGIKGESGGTALRSMISSLENPSKKAAEAIGALGINVLDANGKLLPMADVIERLQPLQSHMTEGFQIFGKRFSDVLPLLKAGAKGFDDMADSMRKAGQEKAAEQMADRLFKGWNATLESFKGSIETTMIKIGSVLSGPVGALLKTVLEPAVNAIGIMADAFGKLPAPIQTAAVAFLGLVAAAGPAMIMLGKLIEIQAALQAGGALTGTLGLMKTGFMSLQGPLTTAVTALKAFAAELTLTNLASRASAVTAAVSSAFTGIGPAITSSIGKIGPAVTAAFGAIIPMVTSALSGLMPAVTGIFTSITTAIAGISWGGIVAAIQGAVMSIASAFGSLGSLAVAGGPIALVVAAVAAVGAAAYAVYKNWADVKSVLIGVWNDLGAAVSAIGKRIHDIFDAALGSAAVSAISTAWSKLGSWFGGLWDGIVGIFQSAGRKLLEVAAATASAMGAENTAKALDAWIQKLDGIRSSGEAVARNFTVLANEATTAGAAQAFTFTAISNTGTAAANAIAAVAEGGKAAKTHIEAAHASLREFDMRAAVIPGKIREASAAAEALRESLAAVAASDAFGKMQDSLEAFRLQALEASREVPDYINQINAATLAAVKPFETLGTTATTQLGNGIPEAATKATGGMKEFETGVQSAWNTFTGDIAKSITSFHGFADAALKIGTNIRDLIVRLIVNEGLKSVGKELLNLEGGFTSLASKIGALFGGGGGQAPGVPGVPGAPSTNPVSNLTSGLSSITSVVNVITGAVSAVTGVLSYLQGRRMEQDIGRMEVTSREIKAEVMNRRRDAWDQHNQMFGRLGEVWNTLQAIGANGGAAQMGAAIGQEIGQAFQGLATAMQTGFQAVVTAIGTLMQATISHFQVLEMATIALYNVTAKPEFRMSLPTSTNSSLPTSTSTSPGTSTARANTPPPGNQTVVNVTTTQANPYNVGLAVASGLNSAIGVRI